MKNKKVLFIASAVILIILIGVVVLTDGLGNGTSGNTPDTEQSGVGTESKAENDAESGGEGGDAPTEKAAPDFTVTDKDGNEVNFSDMVGKPIVLNFWASWCGPCKSEMPDFNEAYAEHGGDIVFMMVNLTDGTKETVDTASAYVEGRGFTFPVYYDTMGEGAEAYGIYSIPCTYFIDAAGNLAAYASGAINGDTLMQGIGMITE